MKPFLDTNIFVYAQEESAHGDRARELVADGGIVSVQILNELVSVLRQKLKRSWSEVAAVIDDVRALHPKEPMYTFWDTKRSRWERDAGLRLDQILLSPALTKRLQDVRVDRQTRGKEGASDRAPVWAKLRDPTRRRARWEKAPLEKVARPAPEHGYRPRRIAMLSPSELARRLRETGRAIHPSSLSRSRRGPSPSPRSGEGGRRPDGVWSASPTLARLHERRG